MNKYKNKLLIFLLTLSIIIPINTYAYSNKIVVGGENVGIKVNSKDVIVVGFYKVKKISPGLNSGLKIGDKLIKINGNKISSIKDLAENTIDNNKIKITYVRNKKTYHTTLKLVKENNIYKTGIYVKDKIIGIGTLTFIDPETKRFGALGHEIIEQSTKKKLEISDGSIFESKVTSIEKASKSEVGEKNATYNESNKYGKIDKNNKTGIYGTYNKKINNNDLTEISSDIKTGKAYIKTVLNGSKKENFTINILKIDKSSKTKNILFEVTDKKLLAKGNGIVQGMSGSPIIQNGKVIGAVTHVVVDNPHKGFGIMIENMLKESQSD